MSKITTPVDGQPAIAEQLGRIIAYWGLVELHLFMCLAILLETDQKTARTMWMQFVAVSAKIELMERLAHAKGAEGEWADLLEILSEARQCNTKRTGYVHAVYGAAMKPGDLSLIPITLARNVENGTRPAKNVNAKSISADVKQFGELAEKLVGWWTKHPVPF